MKLLSKKSYLMISVIILLAYLSPILFLGKDLPVLIHDNLDSNHVWFVTLVRSGNVFGSLNSTIPQVMNGISRNVIYHEFDIMVFLHMIFSPFTAYSLNIFFIHITAFIGMYLLSSEHILKNDNALINYGVALAFALIPFRPYSRLSIASMPLALYAFLNIRKDPSEIKNPKNLFIIIMIPFYSDFPQSYLFLLIMVGLIWLIDLIRTKKINLRFLVSIVGMTGLFMVSQYRLIYNMFINSSYISHRSEFSVYHDLTIFESLYRSATNFIFGHYHAVDLHYFVIGITIVVALIIISVKVFDKEDWAKSSKFYRLLLSLTAALTIGTVILRLFIGRLGFIPIWITILFLLIIVLIGIGKKWFLESTYKEIKYSLTKDGSKWHFSLIVLILLCLLISLWYGFWRSEFMFHLSQGFFLLSALNWGRFHWLHPLLWYITFAVSLGIIKKGLKHGKIIIIILLILQTGFAFSFYNGGPYQYRGLGVIREEKAGQMSYKEFYSPKLFQEIEEYIGKPQEDYRVVSIGMHPAISQYNGFYTLDSYQVNYPLSYKHKFRKIMAKELEKNENLRNYFDDWGSRCYIFVDELGKNYMWTKEKKKKINNLNLNTTALKEMGGEYILSAVEIKNYKENNLKFKKSFTKTGSPWKIWLYKVNSKPLN